MQAKPRLILPLAAAAILLLGLLGGLWWAAGISQTPPAQSDNVHKAAAKTIVIAGDIACEPAGAKTTFNCRQDDTAALVKSLNPDAVLTAGDNQYPAGALANFQQGYDKSWGAFKDITYPVPGNHDYGTAAAAGYFDYFGSRAGETGKGYYTYKIGDWRIIALNSEIDISAKSDQLFWLGQVLQTYKSPCTLAYWHKPRFSSGWHASDPAYDAVWRMLYANGVDIVVNGHSHAYERFLPQNPDGAYDQARGMTEFVSGMGGEESEQLREPLPNLATRQNHAFGVLKLVLYPASAAYEFRSVPGQQTFVDSGTISCH